MDAIIKPYMFRASSVAAIVILLGFILSFTVYFANENVRTNAIDLVEKRLPTLTSINQLIADLNEQERILYQYYGDQNIEQFQTEIAINKRIITTHLAVLENKPEFTQQYQTIVLSQQNIEQILAQFTQVMSADEIDWDHLRELLSAATSTRTTLLPILQNVELETQHMVDKAHTNTIKQMDNTHYIVIIFCFSIVLLGTLIAWYSRRDMLTSARNNRLALFSQRNPNPILSIDSQGEVVFFNQASQTLLKQVELDENAFCSLVPEEFSTIREKIRQSGKTSITLEKSLKGRLLELNITWLQDIDAYDIHIIDITEQRLSEQRIQNLAYFHQETQLPNRYQMSSDINQFIDKKHPFALGSFSIRGYNNFLTSHGSEATNAMVIRLTQLIQAALPQGITMYHWGENVFSVICYKNNANQYTKAEKLVDIINQATHCAITTEHGEFFIELDYGFSFYPDSSCNLDDIVKHSRTALTYAEQHEHQQCLTYDSAWSDELSRRLSLLDNLRKALDRNELFLVFQPQLSLTKRNIIGIETLVRWRHEDNIISPMDFIPLAEQSGLIVSIGEWILEQACLFAKTLISQGHEDIIVAVNVSPRQLTHPDFCQSVLNILTKTQLPAKNLELEITEGMFLQHESKMMLMLTELKELGLHLSIDDFGTGYSSLSYLKRLPVDKLKIDQSFIRDSHNNEEDRTLVATIISLGKSLGLSLIAEGVENEQHVNHLSSLTCDEIQGYWFSKPLLPNELQTLMKEHQNTSQTTETLIQ